MRHITDMKLENLTDLLHLIEGENVYQLEKWGVQAKTPAEWMLYATEELGELAQAVGDFEYGRNNKERIVHEAIQTATLVLKIAEMYKYE